VTKTTDCRRRLLYKRPTEQFRTDDRARKTGPPSWRRRVAGRSVSHYKKRQRRVHAHSAQGRRNDCSKKKMKTQRAFLLHGEVRRAKSKALRSKENRTRHDTPV